MIPILLFFGLCFFGLGDCQDDVDSFDMTFVNDVKANVEYLKDLLHDKGLSDYEIDNLAVQKTNCEGHERGDSGDFRYSLKDGEVLNTECNMDHYYATHDCMQVLHTFDEFGCVKLDESGNTLPIKFQDADYMNPNRVISDKLDKIISMLDEKLEPTYDTIYYKKVDVNDIDLLMKSCIKKDGLWIDDRCILLSELKAGDYIRLEILEDELTQHFKPSGMVKS